MAHKCCESCKYGHEEEVWKETQFSDRHEISNHGRVRHKVSKKIARGHLVRGYLTINLNHLRKSKRIHQMVAYAFLQCSENRKTINHIDGNKLNNHIWNLEFCTRSENTRHSFRLGLQVPRMRAVLQLSLDDKTTVIREFKSAKEAAKHVNGWSAHILEVCKGKRNQASDSYWQFKNKSDFSEKMSEDLPGEIWLPYPTKQCPSLQVSNKGRTRRYQNEWFVCRQHTDSAGYLICAGEAVHRMVAKLFLPNSKEGTNETVNHKDRNKNNNCSINLEWLSRADNTRHANNKQIEELDENGVVVRKWNSIMEASKYHNMKTSASISACLRGRTRTSARSKWRYAI